MVDVIPVSDPNAATMSQKVVQYQAVIQMAQANPQIYDLPELNKQMLEVLGIKNIGKLIPSVEEEKPKDPISENMALINGKPVKAFLYQDHEAHIKVHQSAMQDPNVMKILGQNPQAQAIQAAAMAHINEHLAFEYRKQIEEQLGVPLPGEDEVIPKDLEVQISQLTAKAAEQLLQKHQGEAQQQQAQQQQQDPIVQMQQKELELKQQELQAKGMKMQAEDANDKERLAIERERIASAERIAQLNMQAKLESEGKKHEANQAIEQQRSQTQQMLEGTKLGAKYAYDNKKLTADQELAAKKMEADQMAKGTQMGMQAALKKEELAHKKEEASKQHSLAINQLMQQKTKPEGETE